MANNSPLGIYTGSAASDLLDQVSGETEEERKKRLAALQAQTMAGSQTGAGAALGSLASMSLLGGANAYAR